MMTNLLNGAHVANKLFSTIARLRLLLVMFVALTVTTNAWGADYTPGTGYTLVTDISSLSTNDKVILFCNQNGEGVSGYNGNKDANVSTTAANWIEYLVTKSTNSFTLKDGNKYIANPGSNEFKYGDSGGACTLGSDGLLICNSRNLMKNGTNYRFYATTQSYTNRFYVYKVAVSYAITAQSNNTTYGTVSLSGTTITATPKTGYRVSTSNPYEVTVGTATVVDNGNNTFTVTPESNCTVQINFESKGCIDKGASSITSGTLIGDDYGPLHAYYKYSTSQILYTKSDLDLATGKKGSIKSIYFEYAGSSEMDARTINIYMANTTLSSLSKSSYVPLSSFSLVS